MNLYIPDHLKKVREVDKDIKKGTSIETVKKTNEYYIYNDKGMFSGGYGAGSNEGLKISFYHMNIQDIFYFLS